MNNTFNLSMSKENPFYDAFKLMGEQINDFESLSNADISKPMIKIDTDLQPGFIDLNTLNSVTAGMQNVFTSAMNKLHGTRSDSEKIRSAFRNKTKLVITSVDSGSFIINLTTLNDATQDEFDLIPDIDNEEYFEVLNDLFCSVNQDNSLTYIKEKYGLRTLKYTKEWFSTMSTNKVSFKYKPADKRDFEYFRTSKIKDVSKKLSMTFNEEKESDLIIEGRLIGVNVIKKTLTFQLEDLKEIDVNVYDDSLSHHKLIINQTYKITIKEINKVTNYVEYKTYGIPTINDTPLIHN